jgi:hypothetical protein
MIAGEEEARLNNECVWSIEGESCDPDNVISLSARLEWASTTLLLLGTYPCSS